MGIIDKIKSIFNYNRINEYHLNIEDKTPVKVQIQRKALCNMFTRFGYTIHEAVVPKRLYKKYAEAFAKNEKGEKLTAMERTRLFGYMNPIYHSAIYPKKHVSHKNRH